MPQCTKKIAAAVGIAAFAVVGFDTYTYAGTGDSLILGKFNKSGKTTHVTSTGKGPALSLHAKGNRPALAVDSKAKVVKLNADRVDGKDAAALQNNVRIFTYSSGDGSSGQVAFPLPKVPKGRYQATYSVTTVGAAGTVNYPTHTRCYFETDSGVTGLADTTSTGVWSNVGLSASDIVNYQGDTWWLICTAYQNGVGWDDWEIHPAHPARITLTRIDKTIGRSANATHSGDDPRTHTPANR